MRHFWTVVAFAVGLSIPSLGAAQELGGGVIGGPALTNIAADSDDFADASGDRVGFSVGLQGSYDFQNILDLSPEILFSRRGWETESTVLDGDFDAEYRISYLEIPVLLRLAVPLGGIMAPKLMLGPHGGLFIDGTRDAEASGPFLGGEGQNDINSEDVNNLQFGLTAGAGLDFGLPGVTITSDIRFVRNLTGIFETEGDDADNVYHQSWQVMVGVMF